MFKLCNIFYIAHLVCDIFYITHLGVQYEIYPAHFPFDLMCQSSICNSCNTGTRDLPDIYAQSLRGAGQRAEGIHIRQITSAYVTTNM